MQGIAEDLQKSLRYTLDIAEIPACGVVVPIRPESFVLCTDHQHVYDKIPHHCQCFFRILNKTYLFP
jgi:hypothetical protein